MSALGKRFAREFVGIIPLLDQRQDSLGDQLDDLGMVATRLGMYDAAEWLRVVRNEKSRRGNRVPPEEP